MSVREGLDFEVEIASDTQPLNRLVAAIIATCPDAHVLRDPTRGGLASALNEIAAASGVGIELREETIPIPGPVRAACEMLGLDPLHVANEGKLVAIVPADSAAAVVAAMRAVPREPAPWRLAAWWWIIPRWSRCARSSVRSASWTCLSGSSCPASARPVGVARSAVRRPVGIRAPANGVNDPRL